MKLRSGIKLLNEIQGHGDPIEDGDKFDAVFKFYKNRGDPLLFDTILQAPVPYVIDQETNPSLAWHPPKMHQSNVVFKHDTCLARQADILPGIYYSILGMCVMGYRHVALPPHLLSHSIHNSLNITKESVIKVEIFLTQIR